jgi:hypothetical protein
LAIEQLRQKEGHFVRLCFSLSFQARSPHCSFDGVASQFLRSVSLACFSELFSKKEEEKKTPVAEI